MSSAQARWRSYGPFAAALLLDLVGAGAALLIATRHWQQITAARPAPLHDLSLQVSGRTVDSAPTAFALVALAGVVALLATRGLVRRAIGCVVALAGAGLLWRVVASADAVGRGRARTIIADKYQQVDVTALAPQVSTHVIWPALSVVCALLVLASGLLVAWRGHRWQVMSSRYDPPGQAEQQAKAASALWMALDRGEDPTAEHPRE